MADKKTISLKRERIGDMISDELSEYLTSYTTSRDERGVMSLTGVGYSTIRQVRRQNNPLSESNSKAIVELVKIAIENCEQTAKEALKAKRKLKRMTA